MTKATSQSWKTQVSPKRREALPFKALFTAEEAQKIRLGLVPKEMEDKWFIYFEENWLHLHRSWTGDRIFSVHFAERDDSLEVLEAWVYVGDGFEIAKEHNEKLLSFLVDALLLGKPVQFPLPPSSGNNPPELVQHIYVGRGFPEERHTPEVLSWNERAHGMLLGLHAGDSLGAPLEFQNPRPEDQWIREIIGGGTFGWRPGQATDDTDLMCCVLDAVKSVDRFSFEHLRANLLRWIANGPPDVGSTTRQSLAKLRDNPKLQIGGDTSERSQGNGSLMRCAPLALLRISTAELDEVVRRQAQTTHAHPRCILADQILVTSLRHLLDGQEKTIVYEMAVERARQEDRELGNRLAQSLTIAWNELSSSGYVVDTLVAGFWALLHFSSFEDALVHVVNRGNDSDTCGAVAGALCGAHMGECAIPPRWLSTLERRAEIRANLTWILTTRI